MILGIENYGNYLLTKLVIFWNQFVSVRYKTSYKSLTQAYKLSKLQMENNAINIVSFSCCLISSRAKIHIFDKFSFW